VSTDYEYEAYYDKQYNSFGEKGTCEGQILHHAYRFHLSSLQKARIKCKHS
jgi:hypothetical protein